MDMNCPEICFVAFIGFLIVLFMLVARFGGWATLATFYRLSVSFSGQCWRFQSAELRWKRGWADIPVIPGKRGLMSIFTEFRFRPAPTITFRVDERLAQRIVESAGSSGPGKDSADKGDLERRQG